MMFMTFVALWRLLPYDNCGSWHLSHYDVCQLWCLLAYCVCRLWRLSHCDVCCLWGLMACCLWRLFNVYHQVILEEAEHTYHPICRGRGWTYHQIMCERGWTYHQVVLEETEHIIRTSNTYSKISDTVQYARKVLSGPLKIG